MSTLIKLLVTLVGLQMVATVCLAAIKHNPEMDLLILYSRYRQLNETLIKKVPSDDLGDNLNAARDLIESLPKSGCLSSLLKQEEVIVRVAKGFIHLLEVASQSDVECTQQTLDYLDDYSRVHSYEKVGPVDKEAGRSHLRKFGRVDELLDPRIEIILAKCEQYYDKNYHQLLAKLSPKVKRQVFELFPDEMLNNMTDVGLDQRIIATTLAKKIDSDKYKAALRTKDFDKFESFYVAFFKTHLRKPCKSFVDHFETLTKRILRTNRFCQRYNISVKQSIKLELERYLECHLAGRMYEDQSLRRQAGEIMRDYVNDLDKNRVDWESTKERWMWGRRIY